MLLRFQSDWKIKCSYSKAMRTECVLVIFFPQSACSLLYLDLMPLRQLNYVVIDKIKSSTNVFYHGNFVTYVVLTD